VAVETLEIITKTSALVWDIGFGMWNVECRMPVLLFCSNGFVSVNRVLINRSLQMFSQNEQKPLRCAGMWNVVFIFYKKIELWYFFFS